ncbi:MAG: hypothetical protein ACOVOX_13900, partial [Burkholderiaceae bacterium]
LEPQAVKKTALAATQRTFRIAFIVITLEKVEQKSEKLSSRHVNRLQVTACNKPQPGWGNRVGAHAGSHHRP